LVDSAQGPGLADEAESRWRLVETAWQLDLPRTGIAVQADAAQDLLFVEQDRRIRRTNLTRVRGALNGYQRGRCFYCGAEVPLATVDVDHFFPWVLKERGEMPDADGVWNLVLSCRICNRGERGKFAAVPSPKLIERLHERNNWLVDSHHPLRDDHDPDGCRRQCPGVFSASPPASSARFHQRVARDSLVHQWEP